MPVLSQRALNRTFLERQLLVRRVARTPLSAVAHLVGLQGQEADSPYVGLWARLTDFRHQDLTTLLHDRELARAKLLRNTQHLVTSEDFRWLHPLLLPVLGRTRTGAFGRAVEGLTVAELTRAGRELLAGQQLTRPQLGRLLAARFPGRDSTALAYVVQSLVAHVHPAPSGTWGHRGATPVTLAEEWLGRPLETGSRPGAMILRYLTAFGPASVRDIQAWSGLTRLRGVVDELRPRLRTYRNEQGGELFDVPDAGLADPEVPLPVRFLPAFDNLVLGHADRTRVISDEDRKRVITGSEVRPAFLVDGMVHGTWELTSATLRVTPYRRLSATAAHEVEREAQQLLAFVQAGPVGTRATAKTKANNGETVERTVAFA